ncbi:MAG: hypothetical protein LBG84_01510 [Treponema sp.]|nr:hypothetical protein [Treponema sp.]
MSERPAKPDGWGIPPAALTGLDKIQAADTAPTPSGTPTAQVTIETFLVGRHELGIRIVYVTAGAPPIRRTRAIGYGTAWFPRGKPRYDGKSL